MTAQSLQVDPQIVRQGANELRTYASQLCDALSTIATEHARLKERWTGASADHISTVWDELRTRVEQHFGKLDEQGTAMANAVDAFIEQDEQNAGAVAAVVPKLDMS